MIFELNLVLIASFLLFTMTRKVLSHLRISAPHQSLVRHAQALVLVSILVPSVLQFIPTHQLPSIHHAWKNLPEGEAAILAEQVFKTTKIKSSPVMIVVEQKTNQLKNVFQEIDSNWILGLWMLGVVFLMIRMLIAFSKLNQVLNRAIPLKIMGSIRVVVSEAVSVPFSARFFKTKWVVLPAQLIERRNDFSLALKHELQHHRQGDTVWAVFIEFLQCFYFLNPAIYLWKKTITELQEFSCDEALTGQRGVSAREYGSCLVRVAETALENREMYVGTTCMAAVSRNPNVFKSLLRRRIEMIMQDQKSTRRLAHSFIGIITVLFTIVVAYGTEQTSRDRINTGIAPVDEAIQKIADQVLAKAVKESGSQAGFAIVADPNTGRILAIANVDTKNKKKGHWALSEEMEPASLMKAMVAAEAIEQGVTTPMSEHNCEKSIYRYGDQVFHDWKIGGFDQLTTTETVALSSDICSMKIAEKLGANQLHKMLANYGFGPEGTAIRFPEARSGSLPIRTEGDHPQIVPEAAYGMGMRNTPLEIVQAFGAIANGGNLLEPKLANDHDNKPHVIRRVLSEDNAWKMREILQQVVLTGTGRRHPSALYTMAGKTESSYVDGVMGGDSTGGPNKTNIAGFVGFAPVLNPKVEIYTVVFYPADPTGAHGSTHAAPVFTEMANAVLKHMKVTPDHQQVEKL